MNNKVSKILNKNMVIYRYKKMLDGGIYES